MVVVFHNIVFLRVFIGCPYVVIVAKRAKRGPQRRIESMFGDSTGDSFCNGDIGDSFPCDFLKKALKLRIRPG